MATVGSRKPRLSDKLIRLAEDNTPAQKRIRRTALGLIGAMLALTAMAPTFLAQTGLADWAINKAAPLDGRISVGSASAGWISAITASNIEVKDASGQTCALIDGVVTERGLLSLLFNSAQLGRIQITHPVVHVVMREDGSNLEDLIAPLLSGPKSKKRLVYEADIVDGVVTVDDVASQRRFQVQDLAVNVKSSNRATAPLDINVSGKMPSDGQDAGIQLAMSVLPPDDATPSLPWGSGKLKCQLNAAPLELLQPLVRRSLVGAQISGRLTTDLDCAWGDGADNKTSIQGQTVITDFALAADVLGRDVLRLVRIEAPCSIVQHGDVLAIERLQVDCDLAQLSMTGEARIDELSGGSLASALARQECKINGKLDLARLAATLPDTLRIRQGTDITQGTLQMSLSSAAERNGTRWSGRIDAADLSANSNGQAIHWQQPLSLTLAAHDTSAGPVIDEARCDSNFLQISAQGTLDALTAAADYDLEKLLTELDKFADLGELKVAGKGHLDLRFARNAQHKFSTQATLQTQDFQLIAAGRRPWQERKLVAQLDARGKLDGLSVEQLDQAKLTVNADAEQLTVQLAEAIGEPTAGSLPLVVEWQGQVADWLPRIESWLPLAGWQLAGAGLAQAELVYSKTGVDIRQAKLSLEQFQAFGHGLFVAEPLVELTAAGRWDSAAGIEVPTANLNAGKLIVQVRDAAWITAGKSPRTQGSVNYRVDLAQVDRWLHDPRVARTWQLAGSSNGQAEMVYADGMSKLGLEAVVDNLLFADLSRPVANIAPIGGQRPNTPPAAGGTWQEKRLSLNLTGRYDQGPDQLRIESAELASEAVQCQLAGTIAELTTVRQMDFNGKYEFDWARLAPLYRQYLGAGSNIVGKQSQAFNVRGPWPAENATLAAAMERLTAEGAIGWQSAELYGLKIGPAEVSAQLARGTAQIRPMNVDVGEGRLSLAPQVKLSPEPGEVYLSKGPLLTKVRITPEICARGLKFIAPALNDVAQAEGQFSIDLDGGKIPIADPEQADIGGKLDVHTVQVLPGPLTAQIIAIARQIEGIAQNRVVAGPNDREPDKLLTIQNQSVEFRVVQGRVYHRDMALQIGDVPLHTHGSVGFDESLALVLEIPVQDSWVKNDAILSAMKGQSIQIPVEGTLKNPKLDNRIIEKLGTQFLQNSAKGFLQNQLDKGLEKLLPSGR